jgi:hypothetical protein
MPSRYETPFQLALDNSQARHLTNNGGPGLRGQLFVRVSGDSLQAKWLANDTFDNPPQYSARLESRPDGVFVTGTVRESWGNMFTWWMWRIPTFMMGAVAVLGTVLLITNGAHDGLPPFLIGIIASPLFALMWRWQRSLRRPTFDRDCRKLTAGLTRYLTTGDGNRFPS